MNRSRWITGSVLAGAFVMILLGGSILWLMKPNHKEGHIGQREPLTRLGYCSSEPPKPCILSFRLNQDGNMVIDLLAEDFLSAGFHLKIRQGERENIYKCQKTTGSSMNVACTGRTMPVGEVLQFMLVSSSDDTLFAEGRFPIIGLALASPDVASTELTPSTPDALFAMTPTSIGIPPNDSTPPPFATNVFTPGFEGTPGASEGGLPPPIATNGAPSPNDGPPQP